MADVPRQTSSHPAAAIVTEVLVESGVRHVVTSPGSRNAPLVMAMHHHPDLEVHVSVDERAAGHHALGLALATFTPVPAVCTSGTAALNHGPALAEATHARIPLLSLTADRPTDVVGRGHGQSILQSQVHSLHTVHSDVLDADATSEEALWAKARTAMHQAMHGGPGGTPGGVHLNLPFPEPLYDLGPVPATPRVDNSSDKSTSQNGQTLPEATQDALDSGRVLVVAGPNPGLAYRGEPNLQTNLPCLAECGSGVHGPLTVHGGERLLVAGALPESLWPKVVLTVGLPPMSKAIRNALDGLPHVHVDGEGWDVWGMLHGSCGSEALLSTCPSDMASAWHAAKNTMEGLHNAHQPSWSDWLAWDVMTETLSSWTRQRQPQGVHLANSTSARYAQWFNLAEVVGPGCLIHANRGVAGIDGCTSTALGWHAAKTREQKAHTTWLITGDVAFHYDANAMLCSPSLNREGFKIVVFNNGGGGIFRWLPGKVHADMFERHFETPPTRTVAQLADAMGASHCIAHHAGELRQGLQRLADEPGLAVLEVVTPNEFSGEVALDYLRAFQPNTSTL
jgi:2-succinyl-5-enolpyruvyl-6-hydroxy-3-cyclohexene-1-carboxylate synthase